MNAQPFCSPAGHAPRPPPFPAPLKHPPTHRTHTAVKRTSSACGRHAATGELASIKSSPGLAVVEAPSWRKCTVTTSAAFGVAAEVEAVATAPPAGASWSVAAATGRAATCRRPVRGGRGGAGTGERPKRYPTLGLACDGAREGPSIVTRTPGAERGVMGRCGVCAARRALACSLKGHEARLRVCKWRQ